MAPLAPSSLASRLASPAAGGRDENELERATILSPVKTYMVAFSCGEALEAHAKRRGPIAEMLDLTDARFGECLTAVDSFLKDNGLEAEFTWTSKGPRILNGYARCIPDVMSRLEQGLSDFISRTLMSPEDRKLHGS